MSERIHPLDILVRSPVMAADWQIAISLLPVGPGFQASYAEQMATKFCTTWDLLWAKGKELEQRVDYNHAASLVASLLCYRVLAQAQGLSCRPLSVAHRAFLGTWPAGTTYGKAEKDEGWPTWLDFLDVLAVPLDAHAQAFLARTPLGSWLDAHFAACR